MAEAYKEIPLTRDQVALVDAADYEWLSQWKWFATGQGYGYAGRWNGRHDGKKTLLLMHRLIMAATDEHHVDHVNGCGTDNRRCNLRLATQSQNHGNRHFFNAASGYKGVYFKGDVPRTRPWHASVFKEGKRYGLGHFRTALEAALAYDVGASKHFGEFACLNSPDES